MSNYSIQNMEKNWSFAMWAISILAFGLFTNPLFLSSNVGLSKLAQATESNVTQMLTSSIYQSTSGKVTGVKILNVTGLPRTEESFIENGTILDIGSVTNMGTFLETYKSTKIIFGQGKGIITAEKGDVVNWVSYDLGQINSDKSENYRGIIFFNTVSKGALDFLNNTIGLYTTTVGTDGSSLRQIWQWK